MRAVSSFAFPMLAGLSALASAACGSRSLGPAVSPSPNDAPEVVRVHIQTRRASLQVADGAAWKPVCRSPCDRDLPLAGSYRLVTESSTYPPLHLDAKPFAHVDLEASPSTEGQIAGGVFVVVVGVVLVPVGLVVSVFDKMDNGEHSNKTSYGGTVIMGIGAAIVAGGIALIATSHSDQVEQTTRPPTLVVPARAATWRSADEVERRARSVTNVTILSRTF
jgi:uncharacterized membrane protein